ncbi:efflux RND transporter permease subunit [Piscinibacter gummiphilus]|uniref:Multidrug transporter subunit MdtC n=1 Tax=Piscinibacter gummiphilus TaxID=946333 RepID=A0A1W6LE23_9BURK|nr:efflux RND transporter permease subunit [Piscinibacter gummiphilus]ARN22479.1 multidrug transporter subunit MdtC [Piscinibacter gummiphilus]ATU67173.1 multidrug transporter subunit MdtC [Piscinibacter gummiphilus]
MDLSRPFIERPVATALLTVALLLSGLLALRLLPVAALPQVEYPIIQVTTFQPGASPDITARTVTAPLERRLGQVPGLLRMSSSSSSGASVITLQFALEVDLGVAEQEVQAALTTAAGLLPADLPSPPVYRKVNPGEAPIVTLAITSATLPLPQVHDLVDTRMAQKIAQLPGVGLVSLAGGQRPALRVQVKPDVLASHGLTMEDVRKAVAAANVNQAKGSFDGPVRMTMLDANDQIRSAADYRALIVAYKDNAPLRLGDVATIVDGAEDRYLGAWSGEVPAVLVNVQHQPGANVVEVAARVRALLPQLTATLPGTVDVAVLGDRTESIRASVRDVQVELLIAMGLVVAVTMAFLHSPKAALIPSIAVPLSIVGTFGFMHLAGYSLNNLSLMALTIATGFVVDDAIVMVENIARHREEGASPMQAALTGAKEIGFTLVSLTVSLIAVLIPLLFMGDVAGRMFHEFAMTLAVAIVISLAVSLTLTPMMSARLLDAAPAATKQGLLDRVIDRYARGLDWTLRHERLALGGLLAVLCLTAALYLAVPKGFFPVQDGGVIQGITQAPQNTSYGAMADRQQALARELLKHPDVASLSSFIGIDGVNTTLNSGRLLINLKPHGDRDQSAQAIAAQLSERIANVPGISAWFQPVQSLSIDDTVSRTPYRYTLTAPDAALLARWVPALVERLRAEPSLTGVVGDLQEEGRQAWVEVDRDAAARLGANLSDIATALQNAHGQRQIATLYSQANQYRVVLEADPAVASSGLDAVRDVRVPLAGGRSVPLSAVATVSERAAPLLVRREGQFPAATVSFDLAPGASLGDAVKAIESARVSLDLPASVEARFAGTAEAFRASLSNTLWLILAAVVVMYLVLGMLYESTIHPLTILSTLPSAAVGALLSLMIAGRPLDLIAVIGIVLLIGLVKKNGIMMVDFALDAQRRLGLSPQEAIRRAALLRFRPILMTTLAALFGALPLMLAGGSGAELRQPLGIVMVGGLITSQVLTLFTTPAVYLWFDRRTRARAAAAVPAAT